MQDLGYFDLIVIGGGINGAGIARDAAGRGLSVLLSEKGDLAQGTSSRSGKLVHGGLRYLEYYEFRLVREALIEREVLLEAAPHIIWPMRFVLPHSPEQRPAWMIRAGLFLYDHLGGRQKLAPTRSLDLTVAPEGKPIRTGYERAFEYSDCWVDDARLVVLNAVDVRNRGGVVKTRAPLVRARREAEAWEVELEAAVTKEVMTARGRVVVNAAGPWVEEVLRRTGRNAGNRVRLVKGSHIVTRKFWEGEQAYLLQNTDKRVIFVNPYEGDLALIGTTDIPFEGTADDVAIERGRDRLPPRCPQPLFQGPSRTGRHRPFLLGRPPALRRQGGQPERRHARLRLRCRRAVRSAAFAVGVRRQDHDLSQARRACPRQARALLPGHVEALDRQGAASRRGHGERGFRRFPCAASPRPSGPSFGGRPRVCAPLRNAVGGDPERRCDDRRPRPPFRRDAL